MPELKFFQKKDILNQFGLRQKNNASENNNTNTTDENNNNNPESKYEDGKEIVLSTNDLEQKHQLNDQNDFEDLEYGGHVANANKKKETALDQLDSKSDENNGKDSKDDEYSSSDSSERKNDADNDDGDNEKENKTLADQLEKLHKKLGNSNEKLGAIYERFDSIHNYQYDTFKTKGSFKESSESAAKGDSEKVDELCNKTRELKVTFKSNVSSEPCRHRVCRYNNYLYGKYYELAKPFGPIAKSLDRCKVAFHVLKSKMKSLRIKLSKVIKFYKMMEKKYTMLTLNKVISNLSNSLDSLYEAISNVNDCYTHIDVATWTLFAIKGTPLIRIEYLRFKIISTIIQGVKVSVESHNRGKMLLLDIIHAIKTEMDYVLKLNIEDKKNSILSHRVSRMKQNIRTVSKMTIAASTQMLLCQTRYVQFEKTILMAIPKNYEPKVRLISLYEDDSYGELDLITLQYDEQLTVKNPSNDTIVCKFGLARSDLMTHINDFALQLQTQLQVMNKVKNFIFRSKFLIVNDFKFFCFTGLSADNDNTDSAYRNMGKAIKNIKGSIILINRVKMLLNLIIKNKLAASVIQQLAFCVGAFIKEAVGNQMCARFDIKIAHRDLENSYQKINASRLGVPDETTIDIRKELSKVSHILHEADKTMVLAFAVAEWVGIRELICERESVSIDYLTLTRILNNEIKYKF